ncbi:hypothetical protein SCYAM73S_00017 [Streptomyces cyaneofuscatus]
MPVRTSRVAPGDGTRYGSTSSAAAITHQSAKQASSSATGRQLRSAARASRSPAVGPARRATPATSAGLLANVVSLTVNSL